MKTKYSSYNLNGLPVGCKYCVRGEKLVLFISGICSRNCYYCSLSDIRKNKDKICANERYCDLGKNGIRQAIQEVIESNATSAGITGGDPLLFLDRTVNYAKALKKKFGKSFHIHIYLPTKIVDEKNLKKLSKYVDEVRFNPKMSEEFDAKKDFSTDIEKIKIAKKFWKKENIGIELPMIPKKKKDYLDFILKLENDIGFVNLNEFELSETNMDVVMKKNKLNPGGYTIKGSIKSGLWLLNELKKTKTKLKLHLCTARLKNNYQFKNRLKLHKILPFGFRTKDGMVKYLAIYFDDKKKMLKKSKELPRGKFYIDDKKTRIILSENLAEKLIKNHEKVVLVEEFPTFDEIEVEKQELE